MSEFDPSAQFLEFARLAGMSGAKLDENGFCGLEFEGMPCLLEYQERGKAFVVCAHIAAAPAGAGESFLRELHRLNYASLLQGTGGVGLDAEAGKVYFVERLAAAHLDPPALAQGLLMALRHATGLKRILEGTAPPPEAPAFDPLITQWSLRV